MIDKEQTNNVFDVIALDQTESTNQYMKNLLSTEKLKEGSVVWTDFQSKGRGQHGNSWNSEKGKNLLFSFVIYPTQIEANKQFIISRMISIAIHRILSQFTDAIKIKWPNDIYYRNRKIAGILIENSLMGRNISYSIIGAGININQTLFPENIPNPVSLKQITQTTSDRKKILSEILKEFQKLYADLQSGKTEQIEKEYMNHLFQINQYCGYKDENGRFEAKIVDVLPSGHLVLIAKETGEERIYAFKEVEFIIDYNK